MAKMSQWSEWIIVEEGDEEAEYSIHQVVAFLRGAFKNSDFEKAERLFKMREERIRTEVVAMMEDDAKERVVEVEERLRKELEELRGENVRLRDGEKRAVEMCEKLKGKVMEVEDDANERVVEVEGRFRKELEELREENVRLRDGEKRAVEMCEKLKGKVMEVEDDAKERVVEVEERLRKELEELREENVRLRDGEKRGVEMCEKLKGKVMEVEEDANERVKEMEMKVEVVEGLRKKAEAELKVSETKFKELELTVLSMQKDLDFLRSLGAEAKGSGMEVENDHPAEAEVAAKVQASVRGLNVQVGGGSIVQTVEKTVMEGITA